MITESRTKFQRAIVSLCNLHVTSPYLNVCRGEGEAFTKITDPATLPAGTVRGIDFSPDAAYLAAAESATPFVDVYKHVEDITKGWIVSQYETQSPALLTARFE